ncbi:MAG: RNA-guided endonuclease IscB [Nanoarchaeota archaeon]|nr:RNA-guided endonuclease IscB [Nanoarchaeota archaeon]
MKDTQQKFGKRNTYTPANLQVCSPVVLSLNKEETLSEQSLKTLPNSLDATQQQHIAVQKISGIVYVISKEGKPLMPTTSPKARRLLKKGLAKVVKRKPFTIQLTVPCRGETQEVICKIDSGYKNIGFSCTAKKKELICGEVALENKTSKRLIERRMYRRLKRSKLWYRQPRFDNRTRKIGWLPPSIERNYQTHLNLIKKLERLLPITEKIIEVGNFDIQKLENPGIEGKEYQQGSLYGYQNMKHFLFAREKGKCQLCGKEAKGKMAVHHLKQKKDTGTDKPSNLALLHELCHEKLHKKGLRIKFQNKEYKESTFMNIIKWRFKKDLDCQLTFGYKTFCNRLKLGLEKTHYNDAFSIENDDNNIKRCVPIFFKQKRVTNRSCQLNRKGFKPSIRRERYRVQPHDSIWSKGKEYIVFGIQSYGKTVLLSDKKTMSVKNIERHFSVGGLYV